MAGEPEFPDRKEFVTAIAQHVGAVSKKDESESWRLADRVFDASVAAAYSEEHGPLPPGHAQRVALDNRSIKSLMQLLHRRTASGGSDTRAS